MTPERWAEIERLYHAALEHEGAARDRFVAEACGEDHELRREVESLLKQDASDPGNPLNQALGAPGRARLQAGAQVGPYLIESQLGSGGMGEVWKAQDTRLGRSVALKISKTAFSDRVEREARAAAALNHPHIATLYDVGPNYLVMEYVDGKPLRQLIPRKGLPLSEA